MAFSFTQQQQQQQPSLFQIQQQQQQSSPFSIYSQTSQQQQQQQSPFQSQIPQQQQQQSPFQSQIPQQQSPFQFQQQQQQQPQQPQLQQQQQQLYLFTTDKTPATYSTKWADLHPDSQKVLLQIEERILEYKDESQRLDQCSRLYGSSAFNGRFENDANRISQELGGISTGIERQRAICQELIAVAKDILRNTETAVRSFMMLRPRFLHLSVAAPASTTAPSQGSGATVAQSSATQPVAQSSATQPAASSLVPVFNFYSGVPRKPSPFLQETVVRFENYIAECRQWIEELEQLILLDSDRNSLNSSSSLLQSLPKVMANVHDFFVHVAAKVESIHQYLESMKTAYLADQRHRGDGNDPFLEADRRETAKQEAAAKRVHPTLHLPALPQPATQVAGPFSSSAMPGSSTVTASHAAAAVSSASSGSGFSLLATPAATSASSLFSTPITSAGISLFGSSGASPQSSLFATLSASTPAMAGSASLFALTPASGVSTFPTPFATGAAVGSGVSFNMASKARNKSRTGRR